MRKFKCNLKQFITINDLPDYLIAYNPKTDNVIFTNRDQESEEAEKSRHHKAGNQAIFTMKKMCRISQEKRAKETVAKRKQQEQKFARLEEKDPVPMKTFFDKLKNRSKTSKRFND